MHIHYTFVEEIISFKSTTAAGEYSNPNDKERVF